MKNEIKIMEKIENEINVNIFPFVDEIYICHVYSYL